MRTKLPDRRPSITDIVEHIDASGNMIKYHVTFGVDLENQIHEIFCANPMTGSDMYGLLVDGCIMISIYLQTGGELEKLCKSLGENRQEGAKDGTPASLLGSIARKALALQNEINKEI